MMDEYNFNGMVEKWPSTMVFRGQVKDFTGGVICAGTMANIDSDPEQEGPPRVRFGRKIAYPLVPFVAWLNKRISTVGGERI
jgi:hypothetical protein